FRFHDLGALVALSDYNAFGTLGRFGFFKGGFIKGRFAQLSHAMLYRRHQLSLHGPGRATLLWMADGINALVEPDIRISCGEICNATSYAQSSYGQCNDAVAYIGHHRGRQE